MASCLDVITHALKLSRVLASGESPTAAESADGLTCLQSLYDEWRTGGMFGTLEDIYLEDDDVAEEGKRYYVPAGLTLTAATSEYTDAAGTVRQPRDLALYEVLESTGTHTARLYDRTEWVSLLGLALSDEAPLSTRSAIGLAACLATYGGLGAMFGAQPDQTVASAANHFLGTVSGKASTQDTIPPEYF